MDDSRRIDAPTALAGAMLVLMWGSSSVATKVGVESYDPGQFALLRFTITAAILLVYAVIRRTRLPEKRDILPLIGLGILGISITQITFAYAMKSVDPGTATFIISTVPVMTAILARFILKERLSMAGWSGIVLTVIGTTVLVAGKGQGVDYTVGALILLSGAFAEAWYFILQKPFLKRYTSFEVSTWTLVTSIIPLLIFAPTLPAQVRTASTDATVAAFYVAIGAGIIGYGCVAYTNARMTASAAAVLLAATPPVALISAWIYLDVTPPLLSLVGGVISIVGVLLVTLRGRASATAVSTAPGDPVPALSDAVAR